MAQQAYGAGATVGVLLPFSRTQETEAGYEPGWMSSMSLGAVLGVLTLTPYAY